METINSRTYGPDGVAVQSRKVNLKVQNGAEAVVAVQEGSQIRFFGSLPEDRDLVESEYRDLSALDFVGLGKAGVKSAVKGGSVVLTDDDKIVGPDGMETELTGAYDTILRGPSENQMLLSGQSGVASFDLVTRQETELGDTAAKGIAVFGQKIFVAHPSGGSSSQLVPVPADLVVAGADKVYAATGIDIHVVNPSDGTLGDVLVRLHSSPKSLAFANGALYGFSDSPELRLWRHVESDPFLLSTVSWIQPPLLVDATSIFSGSWDSGEHTIQERVPVFHPVFKAPSDPDLLRRNDGSLGESLVKITEENRYALEDNPIFEIVKTEITEVASMKTFPTPSTAGDANGLTLTVEEGKLDDILQRARAQVLRTENPIDSSYRYVLDARRARFVDPSGGVKYEGTVPLDQTLDLRFDQETGVTFHYKEGSPQPKTVQVGPTGPTTNSSIQLNLQETQSLDGPVLHATLHRPSIIRSVDRPFKSSHLPDAIIYKENIFVFEANQSYTHASHIINIDPFFSAFSVQDWTLQGPTDSRPSWRLTLTLREDGTFRQQYQTFNTIGSTLSRVRSTYPFQNLQTWT